MTATDELRRLLDERGVEWTPSVWSAKDETFYKVNDIGILATEMSNGRMKVSIEGYIAPAQAVEATLGPHVTGETSDGYHTFNELYHHRAVLFSIIVRDHRELAWKSRLHHDGSMYDRMFIVGIETPQGQATYHYDMDYWDMFDCEELDRAPSWDGHTPDDAIARIATIGREECGQVLMDCNDGLLPPFVAYCSECGEEWGFTPNYCPNCGRKVRTHKNIGEEQHGDDD